MFTKLETRATAIFLAVLLCFTTVLTTNTIVNAEEMGGMMVPEVCTGTDNETEITESGEMQLYVFTPEVSGMYHFYAKSGGDSCGFVYDSNRNLLCTVNDGGDEFNFDMSIEMQADEKYYLGVDYYLDTDSGNVTWCIEPVGNEDIIIESEKSEDEKLEDEKSEESIKDELIVETQQEVATMDTAHGDYEYRILNDGSAEITKYTGKESAVIVPEIVAGKKVSGIGESVFDGNQMIERVSIPKSVTSIQYRSFADCSNLATITFPSDSQLKTVETEAFSMCTNLSEFVSPENLQTIGKEAFEDCKKMTNIQFGKSISTIGDRAFQNSGLISVNLQDSIKSVGAGAFHWCQELETVKIGKGINEIKESTFSICTALKGIVIPNNVKSIGQNAFSSSGLEQISLPDSISSIEDSAFSECRKLKKVNVGNGLAYISKHAFARCDINSLVIGGKVKKIDDYAFQGNTNLKSVSIPSNVTQLEYGVFDNCTSLGKISLPDTLEKINGKAFADTAWLAGQEDGDVYAGKVFYTYKGHMNPKMKIVVKDGTKGIAGFAFAENDNLEKVVIPSSVTNIGEVAFLDCQSMREISVPDTVKEIGKYAFGFCIGNSEDSSWTISDHTWGYWKKIPGFKMYGETGSAAEAYAKEYDITFVKNKHTVVFKDGDMILDTQQVVSGENATKPNDPEKDGYEFQGWSGNYTNIKSAVTVTAKWKTLNGWIERTDGWYYYENGKKITGWKAIGSNYYYMDENGLMAADTWIGDYYVNASGVWVKNYRPATWIKNNNGWWYRNVDGSYPKSCWKKISEKWYYFNQSGYRVSGWTKVNEKWYYLNDEGVMQTGWQDLSGKRYYLNASGVMQKGWLKENDKWYYLENSGAMGTGWKAVNGQWYYMNENGVMQIGWQDVSGKRYYLNANGVMQKGWFKENDKWYHFNNSGSMSIGWISVGGKWYYLDEKGVMLNNQWLDNTFYLGQGGTMIIGWYRLDNEYFHFGTNGNKTVNKWIGNYYLKETGIMAKSEWVDNGKYYVDEAGKWVPKKGK